MTRKVAAYFKVELKASKVEGVLKKIEEETEDGPDVADVLASVASLLVGLFEGHLASIAERFVGSAALAPLPDLQLHSGGGGVTVPMARVQDRVIPGMNTFLGAILGAVDLASRQFPDAKAIAWPRRLEHFAPDKVVLIVECPPAYENASSVLMLLLQVEKPSTPAQRQLSAMESSIREGPPKLTSQQCCLRLVLIELAKKPDLVRDLLSGWASLINCPPLFEEILAAFMGQMQKGEVDVVGGMAFRVLFLLRVFTTLGPQRYDLLDFQCESYVRYLRTGKAGSRQVDFVSIALMGLALSPMGLPAVIASWAAYMMMPDRVPKLSVTQHVSPFRDLLLRRALEPVPELPPPTLAEVAEKGLEVEVGKLFEELEASLSPQQASKASGSQPEEEPPVEAKGAIPPISAVSRS